MRTEKDSLGKLSIEDEALYGINALRSHRNFPPGTEKINPCLIKAYLVVKKAAAQTNYKCGLLFKEKFDAIDDAIDLLLKETELAIRGNSESIYSKIIVDPYQGGAGTSLNMNLNEVIANTALQILEKPLGDYKSVHPYDDVNMSQSTSDTYITAMKIATIFALRSLTDALSQLHQVLKKKESEFIQILKLARTEYQDAVPITLGQEFGAYAGAVKRSIDTLALYESQLLQVNLGGTAVGNSITAVREYVENVGDVLHKITGLPVRKCDDLIDASQNMDLFSGLHGQIKNAAVSIIKICNDLRFLASGPKGGISEIILPAVQAGSSIMPGKVNPVILEYAIQIGELIKGYDVTISNLSSSGHLELNPYLPVIIHILLKSIDQLKTASIQLAEKCISGIKADVERCKKNLIESSAIGASLLTEYGYETILEIVKYAELHKIPFIKALLKSKLISESDLFALISRELGIEVE